jgi:hypothetical protein
MHTKFDWKARNERDHLKNLGLGGRKSWEVVDWMYLVQEWDQWLLM